MYNYQEQIKSFIAKQFHPATPDLSNLKMTNGMLLEFLFQSFPKDCISDYELNDIMVSLQFERHTYILDIDGRKELQTGWCLFSETMAADLKKVQPVESE